jgi:predicted  nucleic acid-binding Zn-ribbon protein
VAQKDRQAAAAIDRAKMLGKTKPEMLDAMLGEVDALDQRRQKQIENQRQSIDRLLGGATYDSEMERLHLELADWQARAEKAELELRILRGEGGTARAYDLGHGQQVAAARDEIRGTN